MIQCLNCTTMNKPEEAKCTQCGANLLPGWTKPERKKFLVGGIGLLILGIVIFAAARLIAIVLKIPSEATDRNIAQDFLIRFLAIVAVSAFFGAVGLLWSALSPTPLHTRYWARAIRHADIDVQQAETDYGDAIRLAPDKYEYHYDRGLLFEKADKLKEAHQDLEAAIKLVDRNMKEEREKIEMDLLRIKDKLSKKI